MATYRVRGVMIYASDGKDLSETYDVDETIEAPSDRAAWDNAVAVIAERLGFTFRDFYYSWDDGPEVTELR